MYRILLLSDSRPWPPVSGGAQRTNLLHRALARLGHVDFFWVDRGGASVPSNVIPLVRDFGLVEAVSPWCRGTLGMLDRARFLLGIGRERFADLWGGLERVYAPDPAVASALRRRVQESRYDLIVARYLRPAALAGVFDLSPVMLDLDDLDTDCLKAILRSPRASHWARWRAARALRQMENVVSKLLPRCAHVWVTHEKDSERLSADRISVLPNIPYVSPDGSAPSPLPGDDSSRVVLLVASLRYDVNVRAVDDFVAAWGAASPPAGSRLRIVGSGMSDRMRRRWEAVRGVEAIGFVDNLETEYRRALFSVAPVFEGGGTKIKVVESLAYGRGVVAARHAIRGFETFNPEERAVLVGDTPAQLASLCAQLLANPQRAVTMGEVGAAQVQGRIGFDVFARIVERDVRVILDSCRRDG